MSRARSCDDPYPSLLGDAHGAGERATCSILDSLSGVQPELPRVMPRRSRWSRAARIAPALSALAVLAALAVIGVTTYRTGLPPPEPTGGVTGVRAAAEPGGRLAATGRASGSGLAPEAAAIIVGAGPDAVHPVAPAEVAVPASPEGAVQPAAVAAATVRPRGTVPGVVPGRERSSGVGRERGATRPRSPAPRSRAAEGTQGKPQPDPDVDIVTVIVERSSARR